MRNILWTQLRKHLFCNSFSLFYERITVWHCMALYGRCMAGAHLVFTISQAHTIIIFSEVPLWLPHTKWGVVSYGPKVQIFCRIMTNVRGGASTPQVPCANVRGSQKLAYRVSAFSRMRRWETFRSHTCAHREDSSMRGPSFNIGTRNRRDMNDRICMMHAWLAVEKFYFWMANGLFSGWSMVGTLWVSSLY